MKDPTIWIKVMAGRVRWDGSASQRHSRSLRGRCSTDWWAAHWQCCQPISTPILHWSLNTYIPSYYFLLNDESTQGRFTTQLQLCKKRGLAKKNGISSNPLPPGLPLHQRSQAAQAQHYSRYSLFLTISFTNPWFRPLDKLRGGRF